MDQHLLYTDRRQHSEMTGRELLTGSEQLVTDPHVVASAPDVVASGGHRADRDGRAPLQAFGVLHHHNGVGPLGQRSTREDPHRLAGAEGPGSRVTRRDLRDHRKLDGSSGGGGDGVGRDDRVPVHGGVGERWHRLRRGDAARQHQPERVRQGRHLRW